VNLSGGWLAAQADDHENIARVFREDRTEPAQSDAQSTESVLMEDAPLPTPFTNSGRAWGNIRSTIFLSATRRLPTTIFRWQARRAILYQHGGPQEDLIGRG